MDQLAARIDLEARVAALERTLQEHFGSEVAAVRRQHRVERRRKVCTVANTVRQGLKLLLVISPYIRITLSW